jgi:hypothetical protein
MTFSSPRRVTCLRCGYARDALYPSRKGKARSRWQKERQVNAQRRKASADSPGTLSRPNGAPSLPMDAPKDMYTGLPLYLQTPCAGHTLWALNARHLAWIAGFLAADLREDASPVRRKTALSVLPQWLILARHRDEALRAIARLREKLLA